MIRRNDKFNIKSDVLIIGCGVSGLYCALNLPSDKHITIITKDSLEHSDSFLAQGGICVLKNEDDYDSFFEDTLRAGHYENNKESVDIMISSSRNVINDLINYGVDFERDENGELTYTREGAHSDKRILFHKDITGKEITSKLLSETKKHSNITLYENVTMLDILEKDNTCYGIIAKNASGTPITFTADYTVFASGGIGGLFTHSTNFRHLTGDALAISLKHNVKLQNPDYIQIHPTTLYSKKDGRRFLISESVRGEGAILLNKNNERFIDELLPRDVVANAIFEQMKIDNMPYVRLSLENIPTDEILTHFPNIYEQCLSEGYDITKEPIPVVPAQHYFMGGIDVNRYSKTSMEHLYAVGETACNGVHGKNRLASNSLLESLVFAKRAALNMLENYEHLASFNLADIDLNDYKNYTKLQNDYKKIVLDEIERMKIEHEQHNNEIKC